MSKKDEALKLALETFQSMNHEDSIFAGEYDDEIAALREALAEQPAQQGITLDGMTANEFALAELYAFQEATGCDTADQLKAQPQQEPVATVVSESGNPNVSMSWWHEPALPVGTKLYTSPPAQRTWVGLTEEDENKLLETVIGSLPIAKNLIRAIEAKLREKNT